MYERRVENLAKGEEGFSRAWVRTQDRTPESFSQLAGWKGAIDYASKRNR